MYKGMGMETGYNGTPWTFRKKKADKFYIKVSQTSRPLLSYKEETLLAARQLVDHYHGEELHVMYGGGLDSEMILWALREIGAPVKALVIHDLKDVNALELCHAYDYFERTNFNNVAAVYLDFEDWLISLECKKLRQTIQSSYRSMMVYWPPLLNGYKDKIIIMGFYDGQVSRRTQWDLVEYECCYAAAKFFLEHGTEGTPYFNFLNPEQYLSFLVHPMMHELYRDSYASTVTCAQVKPYLFREEFGLKYRSKVEWFKQLNPIVHISEWNETFSEPVKPWIREHLCDPKLNFTG